VKKGAGFWVVVVLMVAGAAGFFVWRKFIAKHTAQFAVAGQGCSGKVEVEELAYRDGETAFKHDYQLEPDKAGAIRWSSGELEDRAGTQFSVLARGDCKKLSCTVLLDGESGGSKQTDSGQVSCTAMVGH
jgi:hypothetical protein